ncbi:MAG: serine protease [Candidatus Electrothrix sp. GM3_4]|nr:serine protease [Candidatus Electrothrix sp. GM3_4]
MSGAPEELPFSDIGKYIQLLGLLLILGVAGSFYMKKEGIWPYLAAQSLSDPARSFRQEISSTAGLEQGTVLFTVDQPRPVIVSVKTPWGIGSGFFIRKNFIITSKQAVEPDLEKRAALQEQVQRNRKLLDFEEEKLISYRARLQRMGRGSSKDGLEILTLERERYLVDFNARQEKDELRLAKQKKTREHPAIQIILSDGSEQGASLVQMSQEYDLALLTSVSVQGSPFLDPPPPDSFLRLGDSFFVFGGSAKPEEVMITGIFSGYRRIGVQNQMFLQIDKKIPLDKSGGPVLDAAGYVRGVAIRTVRNGKGVGFAIPIERIFDEFSSALH